MRCITGCFSGSTKGQSVTQVDKLTPEQQQLVAQLAGKAAPAIQGVQGTTIPGMEFAPGGPSALQTQAFGQGGGLQDLLNLPAFQADPEQVKRQFQPYADYTRQGFQDETIPAIAAAAGFGGGARSSGFQNILAREGRNLELGLGAQLTGLQEGAYGRQAQVPGLAGNITQLLAGLGGQQRGIGEQQTQFDLQRFMAAAPEADPRLGFIGPAFTSAYDTAVQQGFYSPGLGTQLLQFGGAALGSDERIKENIIPIDNALEKLKELDGKTYNYKTNNPKNRDGGIIAQDLEKVLPEAIVEKDGIKYVKYEAVVALLVSAVNELARKVD